MDKCTQILPFVQELFDDRAKAEKATRIVDGILKARSPRLSEIARAMKGNEAANYKAIQRFLEVQDPREVLLRLFREQAPFVIGDPTEMPRPRAKHTEYVGTLSDAETSGYWLLLLATPYHGRAIPCGFVSYSSKTIAQEATSRNQHHLAAFAQVKELLGDRPLVLDREFSYLELLENLNMEGIRFVIRLNTGVKFYDWAGNLVPLSVPQGKTCILQRILYKGKVQVNVIGVWKEGCSTPMWVMTNMNATVGLTYYLERMKIEIVFPQMTKTDAFTGRIGRDHITNLDALVLDDDPIDKQFYQLSSLLKTGTFQACSDSKTESLYGSSQSSEFSLSINLLRQLIFQLLQPLKPFLQFRSSALIFGQGDDLIQVRLCEPIHLGLQGFLSAVQVFPAGLHFLWQPAATLGSLQGRGDDFRVCHELTQILPDQLIQLVSRNIASLTVFVETLIHDIRSPMAIIIVIPWVQSAATATELAKSAADQGSQQILMSMVVPPGRLLIVSQLCLNLFKLLWLNDRRNGRHENPVFWGG